MYSFERDSLAKENSQVPLDTANIRQSDSDTEPDIISPKTARPLQSCPIHIERERIDRIATFEELITDDDTIPRKIPIYNSRSAYFFKNKMAIDGLKYGKEDVYSICKEGNKCCSTLTHHFFVMPQFTNWANVGDLGVIINLNTPEQQAVYAICADLGPDETVISNNNTRFKGKLGECSIALGKYLKIKDSHLTSIEKGDGGLGFEPDNIIYIVFPNTGLSLLKNQNYTLKEVNKLAHSYFQCWGGWRYAQQIVKKMYNKKLNP